MKTEPVSDRAVSPDLHALARQRQTFLASPLTGALVTLWRAATKQVPFMGALRNQKIAQWQIGKLLTG